MSYGEIIKSAFAITRRNRYLWFFGLFAGGGSFNFGGNFNTGGSGGGGENPFDGGFPSIEPGVIVAIVLAVLALFLVFFALYLVSQGALIDSVAAIDRGGERRFGTAWKSGVRTFWRVLLWALLLLIIGIGIVILIGAPVAGLVIGVFAATESLGVRIAVGIIAALIVIAAIFLILIPLQIVASLSLRDLILREERPVASLRNGYRLFRAHLGPSIIIWLIALGIGIGAGIALIIVLVIVGIVLFLPTIGLAVAELVTAAIITGVIAGVIVLALFLVAFGALGTFTHSLWTLGYMRLSRLETAPKLTA